MKYLHIERERELLTADSLSLQGDGSGGNHSAVKGELCVITKPHCRAISVLVADILVQTNLSTPCGWPVQRTRRRRKRRIR